MRPSIMYQISQISVLQAISSHMLSTPGTPQCALYNQLQSAFELASPPVEDRTAR